jgi:isopenicillin N synthase-like dioxygenase
VPPLPTGIPASVTEGVLAEARRWFALPQEEKARGALRSDTAFRGYQALGDNVTRYEGGFQRDWHEAIDLYREVDDTFLKVSWGYDEHVFGFCTPFAADVACFCGWACMLARMSVRAWCQDVPNREALDCDLFNITFLRGTCGTTVVDLLSTGGKSKDALYCA